MLRRVVLICFLAGIADSSQDLPRCPAGVSGYAGPTDLQYYDCRKGGEFAELITCEDGMVYDSEVAACSEPVLEKRGNDETVKVALGEAIKIGTLYDNRNSRMYSGYGLYSKRTLEEHTEITTLKPSDNQDIFIEASSKMSRAKFGIGASLELEFLSGLIKVSGSAEYVKDDVKKSNTARVVMRKEIQGDMHELHVDAATISNNYCDLVGENSGPTHVISRVIYGQRSYMVFEKDASLAEDKEALKGSLHAQIDMIPNLIINGSVAIHTNGTKYAKDDKMTVKFYGDAILDRVPRTWYDAIETFNTVLDISNNGDGRLAFQSPIRYELTPISRVCKDAVSAKIRKITQELVNTAIELLSNLKEQMQTADYLLSTDPAIRYAAIKEQLVTFKTNLDTFYARMAAKVAHVLPLIKAKKAEERMLSDIIVELQQSPFTKERSDAFLDQRTREIKTIVKLTEDTLKGNEVQLSDIVSATDNECIFKSKFATVFVLNLLPDLDLATRFIEGKLSSWSEKDSWINNAREVNTIGYAKRRFHDYVKANLQLMGDDTGDRCYMLKLDMLNIEKKYTMQLYHKGTQVSSEFDPPPSPALAKCGVAFADGFAITTEAARSIYKDVTGIRVYTHALVKQLKSEQDVENASTVRVKSLLPDEPYHISYRYIVRNGHGFSGASEVAGCRTLPTSAPTALTATENDATSFRLSWARPDIVAHHLRDHAITYTVKVGNRQVTDVSGLSIPWSSLKAGTTYTVTVTPKINGLLGKPAVITTVTAPAPPAAPVAGQIQDNRARFSIRVGDVSVPAGVTKELLSIKYYKLENDTPISGSTVYYMQRLQGQGNTEIDIASFETGTKYGVQVKLLVKYGERFLGTEYSNRATITTTTEGTPIDNLRDNINTFESSSKQNLDAATTQKDSLTATLTNAENTFNSANSGGLKKIADMSGDISNNFASVQKKSNALQKSKCVVDGYQFWSHAQNKLGVVTAKSVADCLAKCADKDGCSSSSFRVTKNGANSGSCELYSKRMGDLMYSQPNYFSTNLYCQINDAATIDTWRACVKKGVGYAGSDIKSSGGINTIEECVAFCQTIDGCQSVTYSKSSKHCNAKNKRKGDSVTRSSDKVSVTMACLSANRGGLSRCAKNSLRFTGSVVKTSKQDSLDLCIKNCVYNDNCESVSYKVSDKTCEAHNKRLGASQRSEGGWTSVNIYCLGLQYF